MRGSIVNRLWPKVILAAVAMSGCDPGSVTQGREATRDTLANGVVRVRGPQNGVWTEGTGWRVSEVYRVCAVEGDGPEVFGQVWDVEVDDDGQLYVLDRIEKEIRVFDAEGGFVRALGREGEGPGEFGNPFGLAWDAAGDLWVVDVRLARYSTFGSDGAHLREYHRSVGGYSWPWPGRFVSDGRLYEASYVQDGQLLVAFEAGADLVPVDSFPLVLPEADAFWNLQDDRGLGAIVSIPFAGQAEWALDREARLWVGKGDVYTIAQRELGGDTLMLIERQLPQVSISPEERAQAVDELGEYASHPKMDPSRIPAAKPFFRRLIPDDSGNLWVLREGEGDRWFFEVFAVDGAYLGEVDVPIVPSLYPPPLIRGERLVVVTKDEFDAPSVVVYRLDRPDR